MKRLLPIFLAVLLSTHVMYAEKEHAWEQGTVVSQQMSSYNAGAVAVPRREK